MSDPEELMISLRWKRCKPFGNGDPEDRESTLKKSEVFSA